MNDISIPVWLPLVGSLTLLLLNGLLVAAELALIKVRFSPFTPELGERLRENAKLARLIDNPDPTIRLLRFGITLCVIGYAVLTFPLISEAVGLAGAANGTITAAVAALLGFLIAVSIQFLLGELVPRGLGMKYSGPALRIGSLVLGLLRPLRWLLVRPLSNLSRSILGRLGAKENTDLESLDIEAQLEIVGGESRPMSVVAQTVFRNALSMRELVVSDILLPRHQVQWFDLFDSIDANMELARNTGHTRFPLCEGDLDRCIGLVHIKDIFRRGGDPKSVDLRRIKREIMRVSPDEPVEEALQKLLAARMHMALVVDEFRGTEGIITLERILELLVGDIRDEFDVEEDNIKPLPGGEFSVSGLTPVHEVEQALDVEILNEDVSTFGGLITSELGRIPERGEQLQLEGLEITVTDTDERRVIRTRVRRLEREQDED